MSRHGPPRAQFADKQNRITDPEPLGEPRRIWPAEIDSARNDAERIGNHADERGSEKSATWDGCPHRLHVIEERNPIVQRQEQDMEKLQREQCVLCCGMHSAPWPLSV